MLKVQWIKWNLRTYADGGVYFDMASVGADYPHTNEKVKSIREICLPSGIHYEVYIESGGMYKVFGQVEAYYGD